MSAEHTPEPAGIKLYHHKTDGGAEYLCSSQVSGTQEGDLNAAYIVRLDGTPELIGTPAPGLLTALAWIVWEIEHGCGDKAAILREARIAIKKGGKP